MLKIIYAGSPEAACKTLSILYEKQQENGFEIAGVISNPPSAKGRHKELIPTPVAAFAMEKNIPVFTPEHLDSECRAQIQPLGADLLVCFAYGHIFGPKFLAMFPMGGMNLHPSMLPKYRGCTPVNAAILNRDKLTAVSIQTLSLKMDEGNILAQETVLLSGEENAETLLNHCAECGAELICGLLKDASSSGKLKKGTPQTGEPSYTGIITKEDGKIDWSKSAEDIAAKVRAYYGNPYAWTTEKGQPLKILEAEGWCSEHELAKPLMSDSAYDSLENGRVLAYIKAFGILIKTGNGILCVRRLQRQGKNAMNYKDFMNGARDFPGTVLE